MTPYFFTRIFFQVYLLELENFATGRYFGLARQMFTGPKEDFRKPIVWTQKLVAVTAIAVLLWAVDMLLLADLLESSGLSQFLVLLLVSVTAYVALVFGLFLYLILATWIVFPLDRLLKRRIVSAAKAKLAARPKPLSVVAITGSYGKTSMKAAVEGVLRLERNVLATPDSVNTPIGISRYILDHVRDETEVLVVEMGAYRRGDIAQLCEITPPNIAVLTGINEAHLERFGSIENTIAAKFEIVDHAKSDALLVMNAADPRIRSHIEEHAGRRQVSFYGEGADAAFFVESVSFDQEKPGIHFILSDEDGRLGEFVLPFLSDYVVGLVQASAAIAKHLGLTNEQIARGIQNLQPVEHRLRLSSKRNDIWIIDDSYNGNPAGVRAAIAALKQFEGRRRVYVTPGLVEMGTAAAEVHRKMGQELAHVVDDVALVKNSVTPDIAKGLKDAGFNMARVHWFDSGPEMFRRLPNTFKAGDVVLFQNDWPENYR